MQPQSNFDSRDYRRRAVQCFTAAQDMGVSGEKREKLLTKRAGLLQLADAQDWLIANRSRSCA